MKKQILFLFGLSLLGCSHFSKARMSNLAMVKEGQTEAQIFEILGAPIKREEMEGNDIWLYDLQEQDRLETRPYLAKFHRGVLVMIYEDSKRSRESRELREQRKNSNQNLIDFTNTNQSPPLK